MWFLAIIIFGKGVTRGGCRRRRSFLFCSSSSSVVSVCLVLKGRSSIASVIFFDYKLLIDY
jgi:hypothetical protein